MVVSMIFSISVGFWVTERRCKDLRHASFVLRQLDNKLSSDQWPTLNCASQEDVKRVPRAIAESEWAGFHRHYLNIASQIDHIETSYLKNFNDITDKLESTSMENNKGKIGKLENMLMENFNTQIGKLDNTLMGNFKKVVKIEDTVTLMRNNITYHNNVMLDKLGKLENHGKLEKHLEITLQIIQALATAHDNYTKNLEDQNKAYQSIEKKIENMTAHLKEITKTITETRPGENNYCESEMGKTFISISNQFLKPTPKVVFKHTFTNDKIKCKGAHSFWWYCIYMN